MSKGIAKVKQAYLRIGNETAGGSKDVIDTTTSKSKLSTVRIKNQYENVFVKPIKTSLPIYK
jgi:hypothetical protein